jgi:exodeoxyribonuclease V alpha subunit
VAPPKARVPAGPAPGTQAALALKTPTPPGATVSLEGEVVAVSYESETTGFRVLRATFDDEPGLHTIVGVVPPAPPGSRIRATGKWVNDPKRGPQLKAEALLVIAPSTLAGVERFLGSGLVPGVGEAFAKRIVETFGDETLHVLDQAPERLREVPGLGAKRVEQIQSAWEHHRVVGAIMIFLQSHGASPALAMRIFKRFGNRAIAVVSASPYRLALDVWGVGFKTADRIASSLGIAKNAPERAQAGVLHVLHERSQKGHVYEERSSLALFAASMLEIDESDASRAIDDLAQAKLVVLDTLPTEHGTAVYLPNLFEAEVRVAENLAGLVRAKTLGLQMEDAAEQAVRAFEVQTTVTLAPAQRQAIEAAAREKVVVVTGGPGVGKTTIVRCLLSLFDRAKLGARLAAPTGRAAKRMSEATGREAVTIHRLLEFDPRTRTFGRTEENPIDASVVILDETSMVDLELMDAVVRALPRETRLLLVGDVDQLPSVGPGAMLRDIIDSGVVPTVRLTTIFRQAEGSLIVENAHKINAGFLPTSAEGKSGEFYIVDRKGDDAAADGLLELVTKRIPQRFGLHPARDVQVLTPMHRGATGTILLNERLQQALNPEGPSVKVGQRLFRLGDKVMQLKNDYEREVYNGDVGFIVSISEESRSLRVQFDERNVIYQETDLEELVLAYATSIHKSQGSEYAAVVIPLTMNHFVMLSRNLLYTAVTRGKRLVVIVGDPRAIGLALAEVRREVRASGLAHRLALLLRHG